MGPVNPDEGDLGKTPTPRFRRNWMWMERVWLISKGHTPVFPSFLQDSVGRDYD